MVDSHTLAPVKFATGRTSETFHQVETFNDHYGLQNLLRSGVSLFTKLPLFYCRDRGEMEGNLILNNESPCQGQFFSEIDPKQKSK